MAELARLVTLLSEAERVSERGAALLTLHETPSGESLGQLMVESGRICWAVGRDQSPRISDIFAEECGIARETLEEVYGYAKDNGRPFGEELVARRVIREEQLRTCLFRQIVAAISVAVGRWPGPVEGGLSVVDVEQSSYDRAFIVAPFAVLLASIESNAAVREEVGSLPSTFVRLGPGLPAALCFRTAESQGEAPAPVAAFHSPDWSLAELASIARHAAALVRPPALVAASVSPYAALVHDAGEGMVCALGGGYLCVYLVRNRSEYGELLAHLIVESRSVAHA